jgi:release factor glutamine methyltransferase
MLLEDAEARIRAAGADAPELSALVMLEHATELSREQLLAHDELVLPYQTAVQYDNMVQRRCLREPLAYILGYREFFGRGFRVIRDTLIPRPETEGLVELAMAHYFRQQASLLYPVLLDVGTGSGALAVTLLAEISTLQAIATDTSPPAVAVARENGRRHGVEDRLHLLVCDLASAVDCAFDIIVANLPYIPTGELQHLDPEVRDYEPRQALDGGVNGNTLLLRFLGDLPRLLRPSGIALLEVGEDQAAGLAVVTARACPGWDVSVQPDLAGIERFLLVGRPA